MNESEQFRCCFCSLHARLKMKSRILKNLTLNLALNLGCAIEDLRNRGLLTLRSFCNNFRVKILSELGDRALQSWGPTYFAFESTGKNMVKIKAKWVGRQLWGLYLRAQTIFLVESCCKMTVWVSFVSPMNLEG